MRRLEAEYNMFFAGRLPKPPWETRSRVDALVKQYDRSHIQNTGDRFRFTTLQSRYAAFVDLWDRGLRAREEGRSGPFVHKRKEKPAEAKKEPGDRIVHVTAFKNPVQEEDNLVRNQVKKLRENGSPEVAFRVAVKDGKVNFTARAMKGKD